MRDNVVIKVLVKILVYGILLPIGIVMGYYQRFVWWLSSKK